MIPMAMTNVCYAAPSDARKVTNAMLLELDWAVGNLSLALEAKNMS